MTETSGGNGDTAREIALEARERGADARMYSPSAARNRDVIRDAYLAAMPKSGRVLEIGSGTGEHAIHVAEAVPDIVWAPSDPDAASRASIAAWIAATGLSNVEPPRDIDVTSPDWGVEGALDGVVSINMIHIAPWAAAEGLILGAARLLKSGGKLFLYGPFSRHGAHTAPSNEVFDGNLKARDPEWGVRDLDDEVATTAAIHGLVLDDVSAVPANNFVAVFRKEWSLQPAHTRESGDGRLSQAGRRAFMAAASVPSSRWSSSPPTGTPRARLVTATDCPSSFSAM